MRPYELKWAGLQPAGNRQRCKPCDIDKHDLHVQTVILQLVGSSSGQARTCLLILPATICNSVCHFLNRCVVTGSEVAVKVRHPGACQPLSVCGVASRVSHTGSSHRFLPAQEGIPLGSQEPV